MKKITIFILIGFTILGCTKEDNIGSELIGSWKWIGTSGGVGGINETPESTGDEKILIISSDSIKAYTNEQLNFETSYSIEISESDIFQGERKMIIYNNGARKVFTLTNNKLILIDDCKDCYINEYLKK